jgi:hypothetical protein
MHGEDLWVREVNCYPFSAFVTWVPVTLRSRACSKMDRRCELLLVIAVVLVLALVLGGAGALDDVANVMVQILQVVFDLLVRLINLFVKLLKSIG